MPSRTATLTRRAFQSVVPTHDSQNIPRRTLDILCETWFNQVMTTTEHSIEEIHQAKVIGSGGRPRTIWTGCHFQCWHNSRSQAVKCVQRYNTAVAKWNAKETPT